MLQGAEELAHVLQRAPSCEPGARVVLLVPAKGLYVTALAGVLRVDAVAVPLDVDATPIEDVKRVLHETGASVMVASSELSSDLTERGWRHHAAVETAHGVLVVHTVEEREAQSMDPADAAIIFYSSGATGRPKGVVFSDAAQVQSAVALAAAKRQFVAGLVPSNVVRLGRRMLQKPRGLLAAVRGGTWMTPLSLQGIAGHTILLQTLLEGSPLVVTDNFTVPTALDLLERERVTVLALTPTMARLMCASRQCRPERFSSLLVVGFGAERATPELIRRARERFGAVVVAGYGSTELGGGFLTTRVTDPNDVQEDSVGFVIGEGEIKVVRSDGLPAGVGEVGELHCRSRRMMSRYVDGSVPRSVEGGWYPTGDLAVIRPDGAIEMLGRNGDVLSRNGRKFSADALEEVLRSHPKVADAAVVAVRRGQRPQEEPTAFLVPKDGVHQFARQEVIDFARTRLPQFMLPTAVFTVERLPRGRDGKIKVSELGDLAGAPSSESIP